METPETCSDRVVRRVAAAADFGSAGVVARKCGLGGEIGACRGAGRKRKGQPQRTGARAFARVARAEAGSPLGVDE
ncbi:hypothetical protein JEQ12_005810 [Ovis aries]|uniref:Uncharacterized protein n=1 Tax=Ovis aries TaxID=9940 RepID=A0A836A4U2_SHEEP|nr:hypothetical protein JEQ12_005810 [Ovis aries]